MIGINNLTVRFGGFELFSDVSFLITPKDKIGLVGKNGAGKSTLLKILVGLQNPDEGHISKANATTFGYLPQHLNVRNTMTVFEETMTAFDEIIAVENEISHISHQLEIRTDYESPAYMKLIERLTELNDHYRVIGGDEREAETEKTLLGLGFKPSEFQRNTGEFSGGWRMRIELAKILLKRPDIFLLDEPTNHLDIESIQWLEDFLKDYNGAVVLISHDRAFLDHITNRSIEISMGKIYDYKASYSRYVELRKERRQQQMAAYVNQQRQIQDIQEFIDRFRYQAAKAVQVQSRIKQLEKIERIEVDEEDTSAVHFKFPPAPRSGAVVVHAESLTKKYGEKVILENVGFTIMRGDKVALIGRNGEGKSTTIKMITGNTDFIGELKLGHNVNIGYFAQNQDEIMDESKTVFETLDTVAVGDIRKQIRSILGAFLFSGESVDKKVKVLSGGERSRLAMAKLLLEPYSLLVLDEPTNHLDMRSKEILKQALQQYDGTLIIVSHDRDFLDGLCNKMYEYGNKQIKEHTGDIYDFLRRKKIDSLNELERRDKLRAQEIKPAKQPMPQPVTDTKERERQARKIQQQIEQVEKKIADLEQRKADTESKMSLPENAADAKLFKLYADINTELDSQMKHWEELNEQLEETKQ